MLLASKPRLVLALDLSVHAPRCVRARGEDRLKGQTSRAAPSYVRGERAPGSRVPMRASEDGEVALGGVVCERVRGILSDRVRGWGAAAVANAYDNGSAFRDHK
mmetsp:Transcript_45846/g.103270  ORF Transcript_45846/g.103270 Transcript_45846/m.103270 type:complete len:104 (+) Transcript_45846:1165-1476(+)